MDSIIADFQYSLLKKELGHKLRQWCSLVQSNGCTVCHLNTNINFRKVSEKHKENYKGVADNMYGKCAKKILLAINKVTVIN